MRPRVILFVILLACVLAITAQALGGIGTSFIENRGQVDSRVKYSATGSRATVYFTQDAIVIDLKEKARNLRGRGPHQMPHGGMEAEAADSVPQKGCAVYIRFEGANPFPVVEARGELQTKYNYFLGNDPARWQAEVPAYSEVVYRDVWPGVDLVFREAEGGRLTYEAVLSPGADAQVVQFRYDGADGVAEEPDGSFLVETPVGTLREERAVIGGRVGAFMLAQGNGEPLGDTGSPAPDDNSSALLWSTFLGAGGQEQGVGLALDPSDNPVVTGLTRSFDFPTTPGAYDISLNGDVDVFVAKLSASGSTLLWSTFLGGGGDDEGYRLALDSSGNVIVTGVTQSSNFPTTAAAYDTSWNGGYDVFAAKLSGSGNTLLWSTFLGDGGEDVVESLAMDKSGNPVVAGFTDSNGVPTTPGAYNMFSKGGFDVFVTKLSATGSALVWSTYLGDSSSDFGYGLALDRSGGVIVAGRTSSSGFPTTLGAYDTSYNGSGDVFVAKFSASGDTLLWSTFLGGGGDDSGSGLALDRSGNPVVTGFTSSSGFPATLGAYDTSFNGGIDVFVAKLSGSGSTLLWSTFLGGGGDEVGYALVMGSSGNPVVSGYVESSDFPTTPEGYDTSYNGNGDVFVAKLSGSGSTLLWSSFLGSCSNDDGLAPALDSSGNPVVTGYAECSDFPTTSGAYDTSFNGFDDVFIAKLDVTDVAGVSPGDGHPTCARLYPTFPDPSRASTTIQFYLPEQQRASIAVYDVQGKVVRTLVDGTAEPGMHQVQWDGMTTGQMRAAPGIYFLRLEAGSYRATKKAVLVR
jgi:hypothetical protein